MRLRKLLLLIPLRQTLSKSAGDSAMRESDCNKLPNIVLRHRLNLLSKTARGLCGLTVFAGLALTQALPSLSLKEPTSKVDFASSFDFEKTFPALRNGHLISFSRTVTGPTEIILTRVADQHTMKVPFTISGAVRARLEDVAFTSDGSLVVAGTYGDAGGFHKNFLARVNQTGRILNMHDLDDYSPERVCSTQDGNIWTLGQMFTAEAQGSSYDLLRQYAADGTLKRSFLPRSSVIPKHNIDLHAVNFSHGEGASPAFLECGTTFVGAYLGVGPSWNQVNLQTGVFQQVEVEHTPLTRAISLTLLPSNLVYASMINRSGNTPVVDLYRLVVNDSQHAHWALIAASQGTRLLGEDAGQLVYKRVGSKLIYRSTP